MTKPFLTFAACFGLLSTQTHLLKKKKKKTVHFCSIFDKKLFAFIKSETNLQTLEPSSKAS